MRVMPRIMIPLLALMCLPPALTGQTKREPVYVVAEFSAASGEMGKLAAELILSDLSESKELTMVERVALRQAVEEQRLKSTGLTGKEDLQKGLTLLGADQLITGSVRQVGEKLFVSARCIGVSTGTISQGKTASVSGLPDELVELCHRLADTLHLKLTGKRLTADAEEQDGEVRATSLGEEKQSTPPWSWLGKKSPSGLVTEADTFRVTSQLKGGKSPTSGKPIQVTRAWTLVALVKAMAPQRQIDSFRNTALGDRVTAGGTPPRWAEPHVALAIEEGWWPSDRPLYPGKPATWEFLRSILDRMPEEPLSVEDEEAPRNRETPTSQTPLLGYSGLVIDARGLPLTRAMAPRILDEEGRVIYPDVRRLPSYSAMLERGMASYYSKEGEGRRAGARPLVVAAIGLSGASRSDVVISRLAGDEILEAERVGKFFNRQSVVILQGRP